MCYKNANTDDLEKPHPQFVDCCAGHAIVASPFVVALHHVLLYSLFSQGALKLYCYIFITYN